MYARIGSDFGRFCPNKPRNHEGSLISRKSAVLAGYFYTTWPRRPSGLRVALRGSFLHHVPSETLETANLATSQPFGYYNVTM